MPAGTTSLLGTAAVIGAVALGGGYLLSTFAKAKNPVATAADSLLPFASGINSTGQGLGAFLGTTGTGFGALLGGVGSGTQQVLDSFGNVVETPRDVVEGAQGAASTLWRDLKSGWNSAWRTPGAKKLSDGKIGNYQGWDFLRGKGYFGNKPGIG